MNLSASDSSCGHPDMSFTESETSLHEHDPSLRSWCHELPLSSLPQKLPKESCVYQKFASLYQSPSSLLPMSGAWRPHPVSSDGSVMEGTISFAMSRQDHNGLQVPNTAQVGLDLTSYRRFIDSQSFLSELKQNEVETQFNAMIHFQAECRESEV